MPPAPSLGLLKNWKANRIWCNKDAILLQQPEPNQRHVLHCKLTKIQGKHPTTTPCHWPNKDQVCLNLRLSKGNSFDVFWGHFQQSQDKLKSLISSGLSVHKYGEILPLSGWKKVLTSLKHAPMDSLLVLCFSAGICWSEQLFKGNREVNRKSNNIPKMRMEFEYSSARQRGAREKTIPGPKQERCPIQHTSTYLPGEKHLQNHQCTEPPHFHHQPYPPSL